MWCYLDTGDAKSISNLRHHAKVCWGQEVVNVASEAKDVHAAYDAMAKAKLRDGLVTVAFEWIGKKNQVMYSHCQHTKAESWYVTSKYKS